MRVLITGASGFAGRYLARECAASGEQVVGVSRTGGLAGMGEAANGRAIDLRHAAAVRSLLNEVKPEVVYHLAALSSVGRSWEKPARTLEENVASAVNLLEAVRLEAPAARVVWVSSCEVYGSPDELPVDEDAPLRPANPYAVSKATGDMLAGVYAEAYGLSIVRARPFNHSGPEQRSIFIMSSLARQAAEARLADERHLRIVTGNPETRRDFTDVRDMVRGYRALAGLGSAGVFNVSSGSSISAGEQVALVASLIAPIEVEHVVDAERVRAHEVMDLRGSNERIREATGWAPKIPLRQTLLDTIEWWERELSSAEA